MDFFQLEEDDKKYQSLIKENEEFLHLMLPNDINIFQLKKLDDNVINYIKNNYQKLNLLIYPVFKHLWNKSSLYYVRKNNEFENYIECSETQNVNSEFIDISTLDTDLLKMSYEIENNMIKVDKYKFTFEAFAFFQMYVNKIFKLTDMDISFFFGLVEASIKIGFMSSPINQKGIVYQNKYKIYPTKISLKSLLISNQIRIYNIWKNNQDVLITGGTGTGKTSQIPKLFWWINMWLDGMVIDTEIFNLDKMLNSPIEKRSTVLSLPRKVLITSNSKFASTSLGYEKINESPINCKFKDVKKTEYYNPSSSNFLSPFIFSINRNTSFENVNTIIFDEIHEHDTYCDIGISVVKKIKEKNKIKNLILITATITNDLENLKNYFPNLVELKIKDEGLFPVKEIDYSKKCNLKNNYKNLSELIKKYSKEVGYSTLIFFPSTKIINNFEIILSKELSNFYKIIQLHRQAILETPELIKEITSLYKNYHVIILSTPIAESSITIDTAKVVIDTGLFFNKSFFSGNTIFATESMLKQRMGRVGRVSPGTYLKLYEEDNINKDYKKIDHEFLLPFIISFSQYDMNYENFLIKPKKERYLKTIEYYKKKGIDFENNPTYIYRVYNSYPCNIGEFLSIYINGTYEEKKFLSTLENIENDLETNLFVKKNYNIFKKIVLQINIPITIVSKTRDKDRCRVKIYEYFENTKDFYSEIINFKKKIYMLKEGLSIGI